MPDSSRAAFSPANQKQGKGLLVAAVTNGFFFPPSKENMQALREYKTNINSSTVFNLARRQNGNNRAVNEKFKS